MDGRPMPGGSPSSVRLQVVSPSRRTRRPFAQVDVFTTDAYRGNPVAVVLAADDLDTATMQRVAHWTNLSETTFVLSPSKPGADYRVRIFTPSRELPFAGHPTLGTCHAWLAWSGRSAGPGDELVQECGAGLLPVRVGAGGTLAFRAPPLLRSGPVDETVAAEVAACLGVARGDIVDLTWADNGPGWVAALLPSAAAVLALSPSTRSTLDIGVVGPHAPGGPHAFEVRAFFPENGRLVEDPVTGSLNASLAQWLIGTGRATAPYVARQGTALGRAGDVHVSQDADGAVWVGGGVVTCVSGELTV
jgi:PhzF family phenazine biosynthesis protein